MNKDNEETDILTIEKVRKLLSEGWEASQKMRKRIENMQNLSAEDWAFRVK